jgi:hypothetical protein
MPQRFRNGFLNAPPLLRKKVEQRARVEEFCKQKIIRSEADPYLLAGALSEAVAAIVAQRVPVERQPEVSREMVQVFWDRQRAHGVAPP